MEGHIPEPEPEPELENPIIITSSIFRPLPINLLNFINRLPVMGTTIDPSVSSESLEERVANDSFHQQDSYKKVCSKDFINSLPVQKVSEEMIQQELTCGICLEQLQLGEDVIELPCQDKHYFHIKKENCDIKHFTSFSDLAKKTAVEIAEGKVIGWFQGRMEWGPRALGNRSILCDPRRSDMKDILNIKIKRRESFRPFAPSILREHVSKWFEQEDDVPFMMQVYKILEEKRSLIPAVTHVDGSGRLQTVNEKTNSRYYNLIKEFNNLTNIPMLLNTSFNENEPVVCRPEEALETFLRTKMDLLVIGDWLIKRKA